MRPLPGVVITRPRGYGISAPRQDILTKFLVHTDRVPPRVGTKFGGDRWTLKISPGEQGEGESAGRLSRREALSGGKVHAVMGVSEVGSGVTLGTKIRVRGVSMGRLNGSWCYFFNFLGI